MLFTVIICDLKLTLVIDSLIQNLRLNQYKLTYFLIGSRSKSTGFMTRVYFITN